MRKSVILLLISFLCFSALVSCGGQKKKTASQDPAQENVRLHQPAFEPLSPTQIEKYQQDIRMGAIDEDGWITVAIRNRSTKQIPVNYLNFGIIYKGQVFRANPADVLPRFPRTMLEPGETAVGQLKWRDIDDPAGSYLIFHHSHAEPSRCKIRQGVSESSESKGSSDSPSVGEGVRIRKTEE
ncbi:MAG: hypothetical protein ACLFUS_07900 [Candidatus Sumerlaeia bacterium]